MRRVSHWDSDVLKAMQGRTNFRVHTPIRAVAVSLWDCGEDELADRALEAVAYFEGTLRPLTRTRRRPASQRPQRFSWEPSGTPTEGKEV